MSYEKHAPRLAVQIAHGLYTWLQFLFWEKNSGQL